MSLRENAERILDLEQLADQSEEFCSYLRNVAEQDIPEDTSQILDALFRDPRFWKMESLANKLKHKQRNLVKTLKDMGVNENG